MNTTYDIRADVDGNVMITQTTVMTLDEYMNQAREVHAFALKMRGYPLTSAAPLLTTPPEAEHGSAR